MVVIWRRDHHRVKPLVLQELAIVVVGLRLGGDLGLEEVRDHRLLSELGAIGDGDDVVAILRALGDDAPAAIAGTDQADIKLLIRPERADRGYTEGQRAGSRRLSSGMCGEFA